jgi:hypothetical protein
MRRVTFALLLFTTPALAQDKGKDVVVKVGGLKATAPADWKSEKPANRLRSHQFKLPAAPDHAEAEVIVMPESRPDAEKEFPRWKATFVAPDGMTTDQLGKTTKWDVKGATVNVLDVTGTWKYKERPFDPKSKEELKDNYRVVWVVVAEKDEATHIRISGPAPTVEKHFGAFEKWVKSLK